MLGYLIRRFFQMLVVLFLSAVFTFALLNIAPGGPLTGLQQQQIRLDREDIARIRAQYEIDLYLPIRFSRWLTGIPSGPIVIGGQEIFSNVPVGCYLLSESGTGCDDYVYLSEIPELHPAARSTQGILRGDFGESSVLRRGRPAIDEITSRLPATLELMVLSLLFSLLIGVPIGIYSAVNQYSRFDNVATTIAFFGSSMPAFFFGLLLILIFSVTPSFLEKNWPWIPSLPPGLRTAVRPYEIASWLPRVMPNTLADRVLHLIMPLTVLTLLSVATWSRFVRSSMLEVLRQDYVRTARAKGLVERIVINKHALRNALIPFVTLLALQLPNLFAGAILTESVYGWPGMGSLYIDALNRADYPIALAAFFITAVLTVIGTLLGDILYTVVDPRIRFS